MREILFRGKRKDNGEWVYGDLVHWWGKHNTKHDIQIYNNVHRVNVIPESVSEFTGLTDKNGKKIFEGDIIKNEYGDGKYYFKIVYGEKTLSWKVQNKYGMFGRLCNVIGNMEVIGNIHDNPELLERREGE